MRSGLASVPYARDFSDFGRRSMEECEQNLGFWEEGGEKKKELSPIGMMSAEILHQHFSHADGLRGQHLRNRRPKSP